MCPHPGNANLRPQLEVYPVLSIVDVAGLVEEQ